MITIYHVTPPANRSEYYRISLRNENGQAVLILSPDEFLALAGRANELLATRLARKGVEYLKAQEEVSNGNPDPQGS